MTISISANQIFILPSSAQAIISAGRENTRLMGQGDNGDREGGEGDRNTQGEGERESVRWSERVRE